jgi:hypothetical protein
MKPAELIRCSLPAHLTGCVYRQRQDLFGAKVIEGQVRGKMRVYAKGHGVRVWEKVIKIIG